MKRLKLLTYKLLQIVQTRHIHFFKVVKKEGVNTYSECRCGSRKVVFSARGYSPIDIEWLTGYKDKNNG